MDLTARYLGIELPHPLVCGASPLGGDLDMVRRLEDSGAAAIVLPSLFEEQVEHDPLAVYWTFAPHPQAELPFAVGPQPARFALDPDAYLEHLRQVKAAVAVPIIASLNGTTLGGWLSYARLLEQAGADALELNVYELVTDPDASSRAIEEGTAEMLAAISDAVMLPIAVKLSPYYTALAHFARELERVGAAGLVLFNRFYQPDVDLERFEVRPDLHLSDSKELLLRLRWLAILRGRIDGSLAASGGIHRAEDVVKAIACGADAVQVVSALLRHGPERIATLRHELELWLERIECDSLSEIHASLSLERCPDPAAFERAQYMRVLQSWHRRR